MNWIVYIIEASDRSLYTGITTDLERRFREHAGRKNGAKYFNGRAPVRILYQETGHTRSTASRREYQIKRLGKNEKLKLAATGFAIICDETGKDSTQKTK